MPFKFPIRCRAARAGSSVRGCVGSDAGAAGSLRLRTPFAVSSARWRQRDPVSARAASGSTTLANLEELFLEPDGGERVIPVANLRTTFETIITRAKVEPWGKPFQNLKGSRETELGKTLPIHVVTAWMGNTPKVAMEHYLQVRDEDFEEAAKTTRIPPQKPSARDGNHSHSQNPHQ